MKLDTNNLLLLLLGVILILCFILMLMDKTNETFDPVIDAIQSQIKNENPEQLKQTIHALQQRLIEYGYAPDMNNYVKKTELSPHSGKCLVSTAEDRDKYIPKTDMPTPGPRIDLSQYVKKSSIPPEKVCPPNPTIDLSAYVKKSTLPPNEKCPPCISPKVQVSAGLCRECPPPPPCPAPEPCPIVNCPPPSPCPAQIDKKCDEIRYIKVPAVITKTITVDKNGNILSQQIDSGNSNPTPMITQPITYSAPTNESISNTLINKIFSIKKDNIQQNIPSTTFPVMSSIPNTTLAQTLATNTKINNNSLCPLSDLNSKFNKHTTVHGRNESNFMYSQ